MILGVLGLVEKHTHGASCIPTLYLLNKNIHGFSVLLPALAQIIHVYV